MCHTYPHSAADGFSRLAYAKAHDHDSAASPIGFFAPPRAFCAAPSVTRIIQVITDNGGKHVDVGVPARRNRSSSTASACSLL